MRIFEVVIRELRDFIDARRAAGIVRETSAPSGAIWPEGKKGSIVMQSDMAVELGNPRDESAAFLVWTGESQLVRGGRIARIGPDIGECSGRSLPFGKVVLLGVKDFNEDNGYERHREIERLRFDLNLAGYMMRAVSQQAREWSRVGRQAVEDGFSLDVLGGALVELYRSLPYVESAEMLFVTSSSEDVRALGAIGEKAARLIGAMNKMAAEYSFDCDTCDYTDVCNEVDGLRSMRARLKKEKHDA